MGTVYLVEGSSRFAFCEELLSQSDGERVVAGVKTTGEGGTRTVVEDPQLVSIEDFPSQEGTGKETVYLEVRMGAELDEDGLEEGIWEPEKEKDGEDASL